MKAKVEMAINIVILVLALVLTVAYALDGNTMVAVVFGVIMLLNCIALFLRANKRRNKK